MPDVIEPLKRLQDVDGELFRLRREQEAKPAELEAAQSAVAAEEAKVKAAEERVKQLQLAQKQDEIDLQTKEANVKKLQGQLFQLKTNKEYATMQQEISGLKADNSLLEDRILKRFDEISQATAARQQAQQAATEAQAKLSAERARVDREVAEIDQRVTELERQRETLTPEVAKEALATYERVLRVREGLALVPLINDACGGCYRRMTAQVISQVYLRDKLITCENCNRILFFDEARSKL